jgi:hypothetical protein
LGRWGTVSLVLSLAAFAASGHGSQTLLSGCLERRSSPAKIGLLPGVTGAGEKRPLSKKKPRVRRVRALTSEQAAGGRRDADHFEEFKRLIRLNENIGKADQEIWERDLGDGDMKRFLIFLLLFPALATASFYAVLYILTGAVVDSLSGPALCYLVFIVPALVVALVDRSASRLGVIHGVIATALFAYGVSFLTVACALGLHNVILAFGLVGGIPAAVCSWLSNEKQNGSVAAHPGQVFPHPQRPE